MTSPAPKDLTAHRHSAVARYPSLHGRVVFISGGASGIGAEFVTQFARQGARVAFCDIDMAAASALADQLAAEGLDRPLALECDVRDIDRLKASLEKTADSLGPIRVLLNNAARDDRHTVDEVTPAYWDDCLAVNMRHHFFAAQTVWKGMRDAGGGAIINMGSISWMRGRDGMAGYTTSKAAIHGLTRTLAREFGKHGIRVNALVPGAILTERQEKLWLTPEANQQFLDIQCLKYRLDAREVARTALFIASDEAGGIAGQALIVDGGIV
ncbi:SDR family NAD(P)-dependent oxidoreductase [Lacibacterium aquatile]|uniref:SDR family NAD(P)-dependent oxidoreductase n=1 Tax=Lacibacterium aquatile TaxID=1168082 RepID=A0ABW5DTH4_9PROT